MKIKKTTMYTCIVTVCTLLYLFVVACLVIDAYVNKDSTGLVVLASGFGVFGLWFILYHAVKLRKFLV
jgi:hypothetical protein